MRTLIPNAPGVAFHRRLMQQGLSEALGHGVPRLDTTDDREPVIVVGMHRSGTSVMSRILDGAGVHMGGDVTAENHESRFFLLANQILLSAAGANWDRPQPIIELLSDTEGAGGLAIDVMASNAADWLTGRAARPFWRGQDTHPAGFGWKDPRTSITWPVWHRLFPNASWVVVRRDDAGVVASLSTRTRRIHGEGVWHSWRTLDSHRCSTLHDEYSRSIDRLVATIPSEDLIELRYEDLVADPTGTLTPLAAAGLADQAALERAAAIVRR